MHWTLPSCESTNQWLIEKNRRGDADVGDWVLALTQTGGRGRMGNVWESAVGNLHFSILMDAPAPPYTTRLGLIAAYVSICVVESMLVEKKADHSMIQLKWPNDLYFQDRKVAGILCESSGKSGLFVVGIGMNLNSVPHSSAGCLPGQLDPETVANKLGRLLGQISAQYEGVWDLVNKEYDQRAWLKNGQDVQWKHSGETQSGRVVGLGEYGELLIDTREGRRAIFSDDVTKLRAAGQRAFDGFLGE